MVGQVAVSSLVLVCCSLFIRWLNKTENLDLGFRPYDLLMASIDLGMLRYDEEWGKRFHK